MALTSRAQRERDQRKRMLRGKRNLSQLKGPVAQGQRTPMNRGSGYVNTVKAPKFQQSNPGADITQAGLAYKGAKGIHDFTTGTEAYTDAAGKVHKATEPFSFGDKSIFGEGGHVDEYFGKVGNKWDKATEGAKNLFSGDPIPDASSFGVKPPPRGLLSSTTPTNASELGTGAGEGMSFVGGQRIRGVPDQMSTLQDTTKAFGASNQLTDPMLAAQTATKAATGMSSLNAPMNAAASFGQGLGGEQAISNLFSGGGATQGMGHLVPGSSIGGLGNQAANLQGSLGGSQAFGSSLNAGGTATGSIQAGTSTADAASGLQGGGGQPWLAYANIGKDLIMGGPGSEKITGSTAGDAAIRAAAAYFTFGLSEIPYAFI